MTGLSTQRISTSASFIHQTGPTLCLEVVKAFAKNHREADTEDLMQEAYIALLEGLKSYDDEQTLSVSDFIRPLIEQSLQAYCNEMAPLPMVPVAEEVTLFERVEQKRRLSAVFSRRTEDSLNIEAVNGRLYCRFMDLSRFDAYAAWIQKNKKPLTILDEQGESQSILTCYEQAKKSMFQHPGTDCHRLTPDEFAACHSYRSEIEQSDMVIIIEHQEDLGEKPVAAYMGMIWEERLFDKNYRAPLKMRLPQL
jgi:hypothetical protein